MKSRVVIKGNRAGMTVILDPEVPYQQLLGDIAAKFEESARFWGSVQMTLTLAGRPLTPEQEFQIVNVITDHSQIEILCLVDQDASRMRRCEKALNEKLMELSSMTGQFYKGCLRAGEHLESEASIVVIGDVEKGARVTARGNVVVLGDLRGSVTAGAAGNEDAVIAALDMVPTQVKIAGFAARFGDRGKRLGRGPVTVYAEKGELRVRSLKKSIFDLMKPN